MEENENVFGNSEMLRTVVEGESSKIPVVSCVCS